MSRSYRKTKIIGNTTATTEKSDKRDANRKYRRIIKTEIQLGKEILRHTKEISSLWWFEKDGKTYRPDLCPKYLRK